MYTFLLHLFATSSNSGAPHLIGDNTTNFFIKVFKIENSVNLVGKFK